MNKLNLALLTTTILLVGCSSNNKWVKVDKSSYSPQEIENVLADCKYKETLRHTNLLVMNANTHEVPHPYSENEDVNRRENTLLRERNSRQEKSEIKHKSLNLASQAYKCVENKGFVKT